MPVLVTRAVALPVTRGTVVSMLVGAGVDLIEVERISSSIARYGERFLRRIYTAREIAYCSAKRNHAESFAARFAAKEAAAKALGTGMAWGVTWRQIEVARSASGRPGLELSGDALRHAQRLRVAAISVSLSHTAGMAIAMVLMEGAEAEPPVAF
ncbi:MAG TPA: holo-ACP synthase [Acidobacteriaceae bacterium]|nr:holo-ACP synthase [Acidobacteriaceae bacterium]